MGDVDWSKRSYGGYFGGADAFSSMGDVDWGKRSVGPAHQFGSGNKDKRSSGLYRNWLSRQNSPGIAHSRYHVLSMSLSFDVPTLILIKTLPQLNCRFQNKLLLLSKVLVFVTILRNKNSKKPAFFNLNLMFFSLFNPS